MLENIEDEEKDVSAGDEIDTDVDEEEDPDHGSEGSVTVSSRKLGSSTAKMLPAAVRGLLFAAGTENIDDEEKDGSVDNEIDTDADEEEPDHGSEGSVTVTSRKLGSSTAKMLPAAGLLFAAGAALGTTYTVSMAVQSFRNFRGVDEQSPQVVSYSPTPSAVEEAMLSIDEKAIFNELYLYQSMSMSLKEVKPEYTSKAGKSKSPCVPSPSPTPGKSSKAGKCSKSGGPKVRRSQAFLHFARTARLTRDNFSGLD